MACLYFIEDIFEFYHILLLNVSSQEFSDFEGSQNEDSLSQSPMMSNSAHPEPPDIDERYKRSDEARYVSGVLYYYCAHTRSLNNLFFNEFLFFSLLFY